MSLILQGHDHNYGTRLGIILIIIGAILALGGGALLMTSRGKQVTAEA